jgi:hypothetical protein
MSRFVVRFMKDVLGDNGHETEVCQGSLEIDASNEGPSHRTGKAKILRNASASPLVASRRQNSDQGRRPSVLKIFMRQHSHLMLMRSPEPETAA